ncbi:MAG: hypothetical protein ACK5PP_05885 [Acidimicrobiales bacterium]
MNSGTTGRSRPAIGAALMALILVVAGCSNAADTDEAGTADPAGDSAASAAGGAVDDADGTGSGKVLTAGDRNQPQCQDLQRYLLEEMTTGAGVDNEQADAGAALAAAVPAAVPAWDQVMAAVERMDSDELDDGELQTVTAQALSDIQSVDDITYETCGIPFWSSLEVVASLQDDGECSDFVVGGTEPGTDGAHDGADPCPPVDLPATLPCFASFGSATRDQPGSYQPVDCETGQLAGWSPAENAWVAA